MKKKYCSSCGMNKPLTAFWKNRAKHDGLQGFCILCLRRVHRRWQDNYYRDVRKRGSVPRASERPIDEEAVEAIRQMLGTKCERYWLPTDTGHCSCGASWDGACPKCERRQRAGMVFTHEESERSRHER